MKTKCPICETDIELPEDAEISEIIECPECGTELEIINLDPITLEEAPEEDEDWGE